MRVKTKLDKPPKYYMSSKSVKQQLALEQVKSVQVPDVYSRQSQHLLITFSKQYALVFDSKLITYYSNKTNCVYPASYFSNIWF